MTTTTRPTNRQQKTDEESVSMMDRLNSWWEKKVQGKGEKKPKVRKPKQDKRRIDYRYAQDDPFLFIKGNSVWTGVILGTTSDDFASYVEERGQVARNVEPWKNLSIHFANQYN